MKIRSLFLFCISALVSSLSAQSEPENWAPIEAISLEQPARLLPQNPSVAWPALGWQTALRIGDRMAIWDELPIRYITLTAPDVGIQIPFAALEFWSRTSKPSGRYGYELSFKYDARAIIGVSGISRSEFLPTLEDEPWQTYLASLGRLSSARLITNADSATNPNQLRILDGRTRVLEYRYQGKKKTDPERAVLQIFAEYDEGPYIVFSLECYASDMSFVGPAFSNLVTSFEHAEE